MCAKTGSNPLLARIAALLYDGVWCAAAALWAPFAACAARGRSGKARAREKLGYFGPRGDGEVCWIHACSVGEVGVALRLIGALRARLPRLRFALTTVTREGHALASARLAAPDRVLWFPFDSAGAMRRAYDCLDPRFVVLVEVELWPNHLRVARSREIPVFVVNARLTPQDERNYRRAGAFMRQAFAVPRTICARSPEDAQRFAALGATNTIVTGNMKYDAAPATSAAHAAPAKRASAPVLLGASTHEGEEEILLALAQRLRRDHPGLILVLAPRHTERARSVHALALHQGHRPAYTSAPERGADCLVADRIGILPKLYAEATLAFVGKSLSARGGQNFLEAVEQGCPALFGPHMENFAQDARAFVEAGAAVQVSDESALESAVAALLGDAEKRSEMSAVALGLLRSKRGATQRACDTICRELGRAT